MSAYGTHRLCRPARNYFRCWRLTGCAVTAPVLLSLTLRRPQSGCSNQETLVREGAEAAPEGGCSMKLG